MSKKRNFLNDEFLNKTIKLLIIVLLFLGVVYMGSIFSSFWGWIFNAIKSVLIPISLAYLIALVVYPLIIMLERKGIGPRGLSVAIVYIVTITVVIISVYIVAPFILSEIKQFFAVDYPRIADYFVNDFRNEFIIGTDLYDQIAGYLNDTNVLSETIDKYIASLSGNLPSTLMSVVTIGMVLPILLLYYLLDYEIINDKLRSLIPSKYEKQSSELAQRLNHTVGAYIRGQLFLMLAIGATATVIYKIVGLEYYFVFGLIVGLTNIIPYFGAILAAIPVVIYAFITKETGPNPIIILMVNFVLQFIEGNLFQPIIMGRQLELHPLIVLSSILFFGSLFGAIGVIFASPLAATIKVLYQFYRERKQEQNERKILESSSGI